MKTTNLILAPFVFAVVALVATACAMPSSQKPSPQFMWQRYPALYLGVSNIQVIEEYAPPSDKQHIENLLSPSLPAAVAQWARGRFVAGGADSTLIITIRNASMVKKELPRTKGIKGLFTIDQAERYDATIEVEFKVDGVIFGRTGQGSLVVSRGMSLPETASPAARDAAWVKIVENLMTDADVAAQNLLHERLPFLMAAQPVVTNSTDMPQ